jgi:hypothetical protein
MKSTVLNWPCGYEVLVRNVDWVIDFGLRVFLDACAMAMRMMNM